MTEKKQFTRTPRITSIHGVLLPPKKKEIAHKYITFRFVILGTIPSKKNMIWADCNLNFLLRKLYSFVVVKEAIDWLRQNLKCFIRNAKKYQDWVETVKPVVIEQAAIELKRYEKHVLNYPLNNVSVKVYHYWDNNIEKDLTNKLDSLNDLFVLCGIVSDDSWQVMGKIESSGENYRGEILQQITTIDITQKLSLGAS
jgi:hypothetical protein